MLKRDTPCITAVDHVVSSSDVITKGIIVVLLYRKEVNINYV